MLCVLCSDPEKPSDHTREATVSFTLRPEMLPSTMHGFAAYFEAILYKDVTISTVPGTHTPRMLSWFPMFFPLATPVRLEPGSQVAVSMWRLHSPSQVPACSLAVCCAEWCFLPRCRHSVRPRSPPLLVSRAPDLCPPRRPCSVQAG